MTVDKIIAMLTMRAYEYKLAHKNICNAKNNYLEKIDVLSFCRYYKKQIVNAKSEEETILLSFVTMDDVMNSKDQKMDYLTECYNQLLNGVEIKLNSDMDLNKAKKEMENTGLLGCYYTSENALEKNLYEMTVLQDICNEFYPKLKNKYNDKIERTENLIKQGDRAMTRISQKNKSEAGIILY